MSDLVHYGISKAMPEQHLADISFMDGDILLQVIDDRLYRPPPSDGI